MESWLIDFPELGLELGLKKVPDYTTLCKAEKRLLDEENTRLLLQETISKALSRLQMKELIELAAIDGSGFESRHISEYFRKRQNSSGKVIPHKKHPKLSVVIDVASHMILAMETGQGPKPDSVDFEKLVTQAKKNSPIKCLLADAGYDSERAHVFAREELGIETFIPPLIGRRTRKFPKSKYRRLMKTAFNKNIYGQRWQVETVFSMLKRLLNSALRARNYLSQSRELKLKALALNIMLLWPFLA